MLPENQTENLIAHYQKALLIKPDHPTTLYKVGNQYQYVAEFNRALDYYLKAIQSNPNCHSFKFSIEHLLKKPELYLLSVQNKKFSKDSLLEQISLLHTIPSLYIYFIKKWMKVFPKEQLLILKSEDFYGNPPATMKQVHHFLNLPDHQLTEYRNYNPGSYHSVPDALRCQLAEFFQPYNRELEDYLGRKFNWE
jgi:hypothetical protein